MLSLYYYRLFLLINSFFLLFVYACFGMTVSIAPYSYIYLLLTNIYMLLMSRKNFLLFIIFFIILFSNYSIIYANFMARFDDVVFTSILSAETTNISLNILVLFNLFLFLFLRWNRVQPNPTDNIFVNPDNEERYLIYILGFLLVVVFFIGFTLPEEEGERGSPSPLYEYSLIFFALFFYYCGQNKKYVIAGLFMVLMYTIQNFVFGGRILGIQFLLCAYIMLFMHRLKMPIIIAGITSMFVVLSVIGVVRGQLLAGNFEIGSILSSLAKSGFALDTAYSAYYTSESFVYIMDKFTMPEVLAYFWEFTKSIFIGGNPDMVLTSVSSDHVVHYGGGVIPFYFYFYLGGLGILISAVLVAIYLNIIIGLKETSSGYKKILTVWVVSTTFRWYLYTPLGLLRGVLFLTIVYYSFAFLLLFLNRFKYLRGWLSSM